MLRKAMVNFTTSILLLSFFIISLLQFSCSQKAYPNVSCIARERRALLQFRNSLVDGSKRLSSWSREDCCSWEGVGCDKSTGHVIKLDLHNPNEWHINGFQGEINSSLRALKHLNYLDLSGNNFSGIHIPPFFGSLKNLRYLNLSFSNFKGNIPHELGNLSHLQHLNLSSFYLTAKSISWVAKLSSLKSLDLSYANLNESQDWLQAINMFPSLISLKLEWFRLLFLPNLPHVNLTSLSLLDLRGNFFNSMAPVWLSNVTSLEHLDLSFNNFSGIQIPAFVGSLPLTLKYLALSFSGFIPHEIGNLSHLQHLYLGPAYDDNGLSFILTAESLSWVAKLSSLKSLDLSGVYLNGSRDWLQPINMLPSLMSLRLYNCRLQFLPNLPHSNLTSLTLLDLSRNFFNSTLPLWLFNITSLKSLDLSWNDFHGLIPPQISQLSSLGSLSLRHNVLSGSLPIGQLCNLTSLSLLDLSSNKFQGSITREIGCFKQLTEFRLAHNALNGTISSNVGLLTNLEYLDIFQNPLIGEISEVHFAKLRKLKFLTLGSNSLSLKVRPSWIPPFQLEDIWMENVRIGPQFPSWLQTQKDLKSLSMRNSSISDEIPDCFEIVHSDLDYLDLSFNDITGKIPNFLNLRSQDVRDSVDIILSSNKYDTMPYEFPSDIDKLDLSSNIITGPIPESICNIRSLRILDLSNNQLFGQLPFCLGNLPGLAQLRLGNNSLYGQIPSSLGNITILQSLSLNKNRFDGKLPMSMQHLIQMKFLDIGENELEGVIPSWIGKHLSKLRVLRLQSNHFYGDIPLSLCQLSKLQLLNLAQNNLIGSIPSCFNNFSAMGSNYSNLEPLMYDSNSGIINWTGTENLLSFMGGKELEYYGDIIAQLRSIDLSQNNIIGEIPNELMDLVGLVNLNLSRNHLSGNIPEKIGNLKQLLSLDLSINELSGSIPPSLANLNFLSHLNLSSNKLSGRIPKGNQLQTLDDPSIYVGNDGLCGKPLSNNCSNEKSSEDKQPSFEHRDNKESNFSWFYAGFGPGFTVGLLLIFCVLLFKKSWRIAYFQFLESLCNNLWVWSVLKTSKIRRRLP